MGTQIGDVRWRRVALRAPGARPTRGAARLAAPAFRAPVSRPAHSFAALPELASGAGEHRSGSGVTLIDLDYA